MLNQVRQILWSIAVFSAALVLAWSNIHMHRAAMDLSAPLDPLTKVLLRVDDVFETHQKRLQWMPLPDLGRDVSREAVIQGEQVILNMVEQWFTMTRTRVQKFIVALRLHRGVFPPINPPQ